MGNPGTNGANGATGPQGPAGPEGFLYSFNFISPNSMATYYAAPNQTSSLLADNQTLNGSGIINAVVLPAACTVQFLKVGAYNFDGSASDTSTFTVLHNGSANSPSMSCSVTTAANAKATCADTSHTFSAAAGDTLTIQMTQTNDAPEVLWSGFLACY
jgi:FtsP/CotA-like multicopper oxidase with cupredoxin domain